MIKYMKPLRVELTRRVEVVIKDLPGTDGRYADKLY
jgi:hypothetical protein